MFRVLLQIVIVSAFAAMPAAATAQTEPTAESAPAAISTPPRVGGADGFAIESIDGEYRLQIGLLVHTDGRFAADDENKHVVDTFAIRRLRPYLRGRLGRRFEFYLNPDFAGGALVVQDAYFDTIFSRAFRVRVGKGKTPFGFERLHSASNILFLERALPTAVAPNRDVGIQVLGDIGGGVVSYLGGVFNGIPDGGSTDVDTNDSKEIAGRVVLRPFTKLAATHAARGLAIGVAGSHGRVAGAAAVPTFRTQTLHQTYFTYVGGATPAVANGLRTRVSPSVSYLYRAFGGWVEYVGSTTPLTRGGQSDDIDHQAWQVAGSWVLTGENATDAAAGVRPRANFDFGNGNWGAFQVAVRVHALEVDPAAMSLGLAASDSSRQANAWTLGLNWYLTANLRYTFNFERTVFDGDAAGLRRPENALAFRAQFNF
jgi:phosphate-selective porin OprO/OprP